MKKTFALLVVAIVVMIVMVVVATKDLLEFEKQRYRQAVATDSNENHARRQALKRLAESLLVSVKAQSRSNIVVTDAYQEQLVQYLELTTQATLVGVQTTVVEQGGQYTATATMDIDQAARVLAGRLTPMATAINKQLSAEHQLMPPLARFMLYRRILPLVKTFEQDSRLAAVVMALSQDEALGGRLLKPLKTADEISQAIAKQQQLVIDDPVLAAHLLSLDLDSSLTGNIYVCPVFADDGSRLALSHDLPATISQLLQGAATADGVPALLIGRAILGAEHTRIELFLVKPNQPSQLVASIKVNLTANDWTSHQESAKDRILFAARQSFKAVDGNEIASQNITTVAAKNSLAPMFGGSPQWVEHQPCLASSIFNPSELALHYNVSKMVELSNHTLKGKAIKDSDPQLAELSYATANIRLSLTDVTEGFSTKVYQCHAAANNYVDDDQRLLRDATQFALQDMVEQRQACNL